MQQSTFQFPARFLWGTATSSHQVEGNNFNNQWWAWEQMEGRIMHGHKSGLACDWWGGRWQEDLDRAAQHYQNTHRLSIEWSRIQPSPQQWNDDSLAYYHTILKGMKSRGLKPMVTLHHFSDPLWMSEQGGWENPRSVQWFAAYVGKVVHALKDDNELWVTINEPNVYATFGYVMGLFPPGKKNILAAYRVLVNMVKAHAAAYHTIHRLQPKARVGFALHYQQFNPANAGSILDRWAAGIQSKLFNEAFLKALVEGVFSFGVYNTHIPQAAHTQDFIGLNYYTSSLVAFDLSKAGELFGRRFFPPQALLSETKYIACVPQGFYQALNWVKLFGLPIIITENGVEDGQDKLRPYYIESHLRQCARAIREGIPIQGYYHWSLVDNFEWERGWTQKFGLWALDPQTQIRTPRNSVEIYSHICQTNAIKDE